MTIEQYQQSELSPQLAELLKQPAMAIALEIASQVSPSNGGVKPWAEPHTAHIQLGVDRGYNLYPQVLRSLAVSAKKPEPELEAEYQPVEEKDEEYAR